ncbi:MAG: hypothetical protein J6K81_02010 [Rikenellaceae bacterium]|nr:hypothetical protein [Rikenellaceae bacterium]
MKNLNLFKLTALLSAMMLAVACNETPIGGTPDDNLTKIVIESEKVPFASIRSEFYNLEFDTPYIFTSAEEYQTTLTKNGAKFNDTIVHTTVDFNAHSLIAITGLASSYIRSIKHELYTYDNSKYHLDIHIEVADTCRAARKWNYQIKAPTTINKENLTCRITTNQPIAPIKPDYIYYERTIKWDIDMPVQCYGGYISEVPLPSFFEWKEYYYPICYAAENHSKFLEIINNHPTAILLVNKESMAGAFRHNELLPKGYATNVISNCPKYYLEQHSDVIKILPMDVYSYNPVIGYGRTELYVYRDYCMFHKDEIETYPELLNILDCKFAGRMPYYTAYKTSKLHYLDVYSILGRHYRTTSTTADLLQSRNHETTTYWENKKQYDYELPQSYIEHINQEFE